MTQFEKIAEFLENAMCNIRAEVVDFNNIARYFDTTDSPVIAISATKIGKIAIALHTNECDDLKSITQAVKDVLKSPIRILDYSDEDQSLDTDLYLHEDGADPLLDNSDNLTGTLITFSTLYRSTNKSANIA